MKNSTKNWPQMEPTAQLPVQQKTKPVLEIIKWKWGK